ncbi:NrsF family protein [Pseudomonas svalbardensis]|uniref:NrsF family protein n=1 Tax=Pseudomonas svalbardensis TaxID=3042029 RepID=UPI0024B38118|nr:NrsF family protein [Pseudomonas sp. PMCC200367]
MRTQHNLAVDSGVYRCVWALRGLAPTNLTLSGACGGLLASAMARLQIPYTAPRRKYHFLGGYLLGMLVPTVLGALLGRRWLRW